MSLINEALKRAESDKLRHSPYFNNLTVLPPADDEAPAPPRGDVHSPKGGASVLWYALAGLLLAGIAAGGWQVWRRHGGPASAGAAPARPAAEAPISEVVAAVPVRTPASPPPQPAGPPQTEAPAAGRAPPAAPPTLRRVHPDPPGAWASPPRGPDTAPADAAAQPPCAATEPATTAPVAAFVPTGTSPPHREAARAAAPAPAAFTSFARVDSRKFHLSAIMRGPEGNAALINGHLYQEGQTVDGAKIVKIGSHHVELELRGERISVRM